MNIDTDLRGTPTLIAIWLFMGLTFTDVLLAITSYRFEWPVERDGALGIGSICVSVGFGIGVAFIIRRRAMFKLYGHRRFDRNQPTHGTMPKDWDKK